MSVRVQVEQLRAAQARQKRLESLYEELAKECGASNLYWMGSKKLLIYVADASTVNIDKMEETERKFAALGVELELANLNDRL